MIPTLVESTGQNLDDVRIANRALIFRSIYEAGLISRAMLAKVTGLNPATITHIARELVQLGLVEEAGCGTSRGGRPGSMLRVRSQAGTIISIQLDRLFIRGMLANLSLEEKELEQRVSSAPLHPTDINLDLLLQCVRSLVGRAGETGRKLLGIGVCAPGPLDAANGILLSPPNFPAWVDINLRQILASEFHVPVFLDQDANACALAEKWFGATREYDNFVYVLGDGGLGGGLFLNGDIYRGSRNIAGEIGHTTVSLQGPRCSCGNIGCLELYASAHALEQRAYQALSAGRSSQLFDMVAGNLERITLHAIAQAAREGDELCIELVTDMGVALGAGLLNICNMIDPQAIVIGGQISLLEDLIQVPLLERMSASNLSGTTPPVLFSKLRQDAPIIGAFSLVLRELYRDPYLINN
jgi:N-acetylglucosamine repressor